MLKYSVEAPQINDGGNRPEYTYRIQENLMSNGNDEAKVTNHHGSDNQSTPRRMLAILQPRLKDRLPDAAQIRFIVDFVCQFDKV